MSSIDWAVLLCTIGFIVVYGAWKNKKNSNINEYIKGGNEARWWTIGLSVMATQASAITFLSTPGQAYQDGMGFVQFYFGLPIAIVIISLFFVPLYTKFKVYTAYEYLEQRFDKRMRTVTAFLFLIQRGLAAGITIYAPAIILSAVLQWDLKTLIFIIGIFVISYTLIGGTRAVNVTQKQQMIVIFSGLIITFGYILYGFPEEISFSKALIIAGGSQKLNVLNFDFDLSNRFTFWSGLLGGTFLMLSYFGTDQSQVQRYLSGKSLRESQLGLIFNGFLKIPMQFFILLLGVLVFVFYQFRITPLSFNPEVVETLENSHYQAEFDILKEKNIALQQTIKNSLLSPEYYEDKQYQEKVSKLMKQEQEQREVAQGLVKLVDKKIKTDDKDYIFISFILTYLPHGLIGLLLAVILSAAMSSTASELNALAATTTVDLYKRNISDKSDKHYVLASKGFTIFWGIVALFFASISHFVDNLIVMVNIIGSLFYGTILGIFLVAFFIKFIKSKAVFWGALCSQALIFVIYNEDIVSFLWLNMIGAGLTIILSLLFSLGKKS